MSLRNDINSMQFERKYNRVLVEIQQDSALHLHIALKNLKLLLRETPDIIPLDLYIETAQKSTQLAIRYGRPCRNVFTIQR